MEDLSHLGIAQEIEIPLAVTGFGIFESVILLRKRTEALRQKYIAGCQEGQFLGPGAEDPPLHSDKVPKIQ